MLKLQLKCRGGGFWDAVNCAELMSWLRARHWQAGAKLSPTTDVTSAELDWRTKTLSWNKTRRALPIYKKSLRKNRDTAVVMTAVHRAVWLWINQSINQSIWRWRSFLSCRAEIVHLLICQFDWRVVAIADSWQLWWHSHWSSPWRYFYLFNWITNFTLAHVTVFSDHLYHILGLGTTNLRAFLPVHCKNTVLAFHTFDVDYRFKARQSNV